VAANDHLMALFWIRRVAPARGAAAVQFNFEKVGGNFDKSLQFPVTLSDSNCHLVAVKFNSIAGYPAGAAEISLWAGYGLQTVEIGGMTMQDYGTSTPP
jgi:hypothetical protein